MNVIETPLAGLIVIEPKIFNDTRGHFFESYQQKRFEALGIPHFVQDNLSKSKRNAIRGLHYQLPRAQGKLVGVLQGTVWDVVVDIRVSSPTFGKWFGITLSDENYTQVYIPPGFAHGFCALSDEAVFYYKCTDFYEPTAEQGIAWDDADLNISWPVTSPLLSEKDKLNPVLREISREKLFP